MTGPLRPLRCLQERMVEHVVTEFEFWRLSPLLLSAIGQTIFLAFYGLPALGAGKWWKDPVGRAIFIKSSTLALLLDSIVLSFISKWIDGEWSGISFHITKYDGNLDYLILVGYWAVCFGVYYQMVALIRQRLRVRQGREAVRFHP